MEKKVYCRMHCRGYNRPVLHTKRKKKKSNRKGQCDDPEILNLASLCGELDLLV